ncbi:dihydroorotate dehydrogenase electron transfer subunit [Candidatus Peregrinibacteria bacterium RIFOXYA2_FULL_33_21]|nr:MAG: dihydroorotate dehydrogenase electron transfer subunit [Candidatus Peregrinibacteria bacterium RIFOXYA2_FULL_33_21]
MDIPKAVKILDIVQENSIVKTYTLDISLGAYPGQFVNLWIPGLNEKPFSVAMDDGKKMKFSIAKVGSFTEKLDSYKVGQKLGIRGPYGTGFVCEKNQHLVLIAGGYGAAPLFNFAQQASQNGCKIEFIVGARNKDLLLYIDKIKEIENVNLHICTDDGSMGFKGYTTDFLKKILETEKINCICTCGPEVMMKKISDIAYEKGIKAQISVERYMKCGFGICGNCVNDGTGKPSCKNGPVMWNEDVRKLTDFGKYHRDAEGRKISY